MIYLNQLEHSRRRPAYRRPSCSGLLNNPLISLRLSADFRYRRRRDTPAAFRRLAREAADRCASSRSVPIGTFAFSTRIKRGRSKVLLGTWLRRHRFISGGRPKCLLLHHNEMPLAPCNPRNRLHSIRVQKTCAYSFAIGAIAPNRKPAPLDNDRGCRRSAPGRGCFHPAGGIWGRDRAGPPQSRSAP
jgi:hypothetical protein